MSKHSKIAAIKGMNDILPPESALWQRLEQQVRAVMRLHAYRNVRTPILEHTQLFARGLGEVTDVVEKEMYSFADRADKHGAADLLSLRPENTAGVVRAAVQHNLLYDGGKRLYYMGPMFRRERPQRGRYRQFHQIGAEALGFAGPAVDAEIILLAAYLWQELGISDWRLELGCLGQPSERRAHRAALIDYFERHHAQLDEDAQRRLHSNPLRILDTKNPHMQELVENAPLLMDYLGAASRAYFDQVQAILRANGLDFVVNPRLVRGLDYYNLTVFEFITDQLGAQGTICGGGRYDYLIEQIGGKPAPAVGWAIGVERVLELLAAQALPLNAVVDAYAIVEQGVDLGVVMRYLQALRHAGVSVQMHAGNTVAPASMKSQFKRADASGAHHALIFGRDEMAAAELAIKPLRNDGAQRREKLDDLPLWAESLKSDPREHAAAAD